MFFNLVDIPIWCYAIALVISGVVWKIWRLDMGLLVGYLFLVLCATVLIRTPFDGVHYQPKLFWSWRDWKNQSRQVIANVAMFVPVGFLLGRRSGLWTIPISIGMSFAIELLQMITGRGLMEFDDMVHNCIGAVIGFGAVLLIKNLIRNRNDAYE